LRRSSAITSWTSASLSIRRGEAGLAGEDRVVVDAPLLEQLGPDGLGEPEVEGVVTVQVAELALAEGEGELAAAAGPRLHARPGGDLLGDLLAGRA
jgi:hypothetical protein